MTRVEEVYGFTAWDRGRGGKLSNGRKDISKISLAADATEEQRSRKAIA